MTRVVHYVNQFFAGLGGEDQAGIAPSLKEGAVGPGRRLAQLLGDDAEIVATVYCGDDYAASVEGAAAQILALVMSYEPDVLIAGPAFGSGRYGLACARLGAAADAAGLPVVVAMHEDNPGLDEAGTIPVVASGATSREMRASLDRLGAAARKVIAGDALTSDDGRIGRPPRPTTVAETTAAERAVDLVLTRLAGDRDATEIPLPRFDRVMPAQPIEDPATATVALVTEGAVVPNGNPDGLESARATRWLRYPIDEVASLASGDYVSVHGGFSTSWANEDPCRILPLDVARELEQEGAIGKLHAAYLVTAGNGTSVANARRFGIEWAAELRKAGVQAAVLTST
jgi:glycine reductase complex component B subunit gamma